MFACCDSGHYRATDYVRHRVGYRWERGGFVRTPSAHRKGGQGESGSKAGGGVGGALSRRGWKSLSAGIRHSCVPVAWVPVAAHLTPHTPHARACAPTACVGMWIRRGEFRRRYNLVGVGRNVIFGRRNMSSGREQIRPRRIGCLPENRRTESGRSARIAAWRTSAGNGEWDRFLRAANRRIFFSLLYRKPHEKVSVVKMVGTRDKSVWRGTIRRIGWKIYTWAVVSDYWQRYMYKLDDE